MFRALADPTRRELLDELFKEDGQTLTALEQRLPMTRFGVMKHLKVLEEAGLVVARRRGREKLHYLNAVPIRLVHDRWVSKFAEPWAATLSELKTSIEEAVMEKVFEIYIKTTPERLWQAITDSEMKARYSFGVGISSDWTDGSSYEAVHSGAGIPISVGENLEVDRPRRLVQSFTALWSDKVQNEGTSRVTWEIEPVGDSCRLTVTHDEPRLLEHLEVIHDAEALHRQALLQSAQRLHVLLEQLVEQAAARRVGEGLEHCVHAAQHR